MPPLLMRKNNARHVVNYLVAKKLPFNLTASNYTALIEAENIKEKFVMSIQSNRTFAAFAKIKSNVKDKPVPEIDREQLRYFQHNFKRTCEYPKVYNIDLKSAYATILRNDGLITEETFRYLSKCTKPERLACVGMLASKKQFFEFKDGVPTQTHTTESPFCNFFYHAVQRTDEIMTILKEACAHSYLFTWVDGIYYADDGATSHMQDILFSNNFKNSYEVLEDFKVKIFEGKIKVSYLKDGEKKQINMPTTNTEFQRLTTNAIQLVNR